MILLFITLSLSFYYCFARDILDYLVNYLTISELGQSCYVEKNNL